MDSIFDLLSATLFVAAAALFFMRNRHENPPLAPYIIVGMVAAVGNWLGHQAGGHISSLAAVAFLIAGAFLTLHLASEPFRDDREKNANARD